MQKTPEQIIRELTDKIKDLECALQKTKENSGYGLKREEKPEIFEERAQNALPVLKEKNDLFIDNKSDLDHLIIEGDNYHILSALSYTHKGKIDLIYIDPPYNTGNKDFVYNDNYVDSEDSYRHSKWLSFMNKRLRLAKELLSDEGVIFISIDDNEQANLKLLCDQIFGEESFIIQFVWQKTAGAKNNARLVSSNHEYIFAYAKNKALLSLLWDERTEAAMKDYKNPDNDYRWAWSRTSMLAPWYTEKNRYEMVFANGKKYYPDEWKSWRYSKEKMLELEADGRISFEPNMPRKKTFLSEVDKVPPKSLLLQDLAGNNQQWTTEIQDIFWDKTMFSFPKPKKLLNYLISKLLNKHSTILDFFAGSGTTGHAVLELNKQDWGARQFILCSNSEATAIEPEKNICRNITYERVKRVMQGYKNAKGEAIEGLWGGNLRYYTTDFIKKEKSTDDLRQKFIYLCDELLCIKEDTFIVLNSDYCSDQLRCYYKSDHYTVILYDLWQMDKLQQLIAGVNGQVSLYLFSLSKDAYEEELLLLKDKVKIENVPDDILETYHKIF